MRIGHDRLPGITVNAGAIAEYVGIHEDHQASLAQIATAFKVLNVDVDLPRKLLLGYVPFSITPNRHLECLSAFSKARFYILTLPPPNGTSSLEQSSFSPNPFMKVILPSSWPLEMMIGHFTLQMMIVCNIAPAYSFKQLLQFLRNPRESQSVLICQELQRFGINPIGLTYVLDQEMNLRGVAYDHYDQLHADAQDHYAKRAKKEKREASKRRKSCRNYQPPPTTKFM